MGYTTIEFQIEDDTGIIRLNRPHRMNAVIEAMYIEIQQMYGFDHESILLLEADAVFSCMNTEDWHEGIRSFNEGRAPQFKGV